MKSNENPLILILDIFFVLFLCFILLLFTMLLNRDGGMQAADIYIINPAMMAAVVISVVAYLYFMTRASVSELSNILYHGFDFSSCSDNAEKHGEAE